ncbi:MAG: hypothetical protein K2K45_09240 [Muribaculaceae bacterium]|nr:hypothetical protein [Muribaculaceae bacterium]
MRLKSFIAVSAIAAGVAECAAFEWEPLITQPNPSVDVAQLYQLASLSFHCNGIDGVEMTDIMPKWIDEDGNEVVAFSGEHDPWGWDATEFQYNFDVNEFKSNGEYILQFPEGMLLNAAGEKSAVVEIPYTFDINDLAGAMFDDFRVISITPDLSQPQGFWSEQPVTVNTNHNDAVGLTTLQVIDKTTGESMFISSNFSTGRGLGDSSAISWTCQGTFKFLEGHQYSAEFIFYNGSNDYTDAGPTPVVDRKTYEFTGKIEGFKYSDVELLSVTPDPEFVTISEPSQAVITFKFSAPVTVYRAETPLGQNGIVSYTSSCLSSNGDKTEWTLDLSDDEYVKTVDSMLSIYIYVRDEDGNQLKGDYGAESESCFIREWQCDLGAKPIVLVSPAAGARIDRLTEVVVKSESGEPMTWSWNGEVNIMDEDGVILGSLAFDEEKYSEDSSSVEFKFTKIMDDSWNIAPIDISKAGNYTVVFSSGCFVFGSEFDSYYSRSLTSAFTITGGSGVQSVAAASGSIVYDLNGRIVLRNAASSGLNKLPKGIYVMDGKKLVVK